MKQYRIDKGKLNPHLPALTVHQKIVVLPTIACTIATTSNQPKPNPEPKTGVSTKSPGR
jgi:hypothetical protein